MILFESDYPIGNPNRYIAGVLFDHLTRFQAGSADMPRLIYSPLILNYPLLI